MSLSSRFKNLKQILVRRWSSEDVPGAVPRFQIDLLARDIVVFGLIPISAVIFYKLIEVSLTSRARPRERLRTLGIAERQEISTSQIIDFRNNSPNGHRLNFPKRSPGTVVRVRLLNVVETLSSAPVHAQIVDRALGQELLGGTLLGNATAEENIGRIKIDFSFVRHPRRLDTALPISARAVSLDGTYGVVATRKEGFFSRVATHPSSVNTNDLDSSMLSQDLKTLVARSLASGILQEFTATTSREQSKAQLFTLQPMTEFYVELTDFFPSQR